MAVCSAWEEVIVRGSPSLCPWLFACLGLYMWVLSLWTSTTPEPILVMRSNTVLKHDPTISLNCTSFGCKSVDFFSASVHRLCSSACLVSTANNSDGFLPCSSSSLCVLLLLIAICLQLLLTYRLPFVRVACVPISTPSSPFNKLVQFYKLVLLTPAV